jgi:hypothetical protein
VRARAIETVAESGRGAGARPPHHSRRDAGATKKSSYNVSLGGNSALALLAGRTKASLHKLAEGAGGVVEHGEGQQEDQEENCRGYDELQEFLAGTS